MAKIQIVGNAVVVTSGLTISQLEKLSKFKPETLKLVEKDVELFAVTLDKSDQGFFSKWGIVFTNKNSEGLAQTTLMIPNLPHESKIEYVKDNFGYGLLNLNRIESTIQEAYALLVHEFNVMEQSITIN